jgi:hypothetical protein
MSSVKKSSHHRNTEEIRQNVEVQVWKGLDSESALGVPIKHLEPTSEGIQHFRGRKSTSVSNLFGD